MKQDNAVLDMEQQGPSATNDMMLSEEPDSDGADLYAGLDTGQADADEQGTIVCRQQRMQLQELQATLAQKDGDITSLRQQLRERDRQMQQLSAQRLVLLANISSLFKTAQAEMKRHATMLQDCRVQLATLQAQLKRSKKPPAAANGSQSAGRTGKAAKKQGQQQGQQQEQHGKQQQGQHGKQQQRQQLQQKEWQHQQQLSRQGSAQSRQQAASEQQHQQYGEQQYALVDVSATAPNHADAEHMQQQHSGRHERQQNSQGQQQRQQQWQDWKQQSSGCAEHNSGGSRAHASYVLSGGKRHRSHSPQRDRLPSKRRDVQHDRDRHRRHDTYLK